MAVAQIVRRPERDPGRLACLRDRGAEREARIRSSRSGDTSTQSALRVLIVADRSLTRWRRSSRLAALKMFDVEAALVLAFTPPGARLVATRRNCFIPSVEGVDRRDEGRRASADAVRIVATTKRDAIVAGQDGWQEREGEIEARETNQSVDDSSYCVRRSELFPKDLRNEVELSERHQSPVQGADDDENQGKAIQNFHAHSSFSLVGGVFPDSF
jgi:hypothetical protein